PVPFTAPKTSSFLALWHVRDDVLLSSNDAATPEIYTLSLHDALPISMDPATRLREVLPPAIAEQVLATIAQARDRQLPAAAVVADRKSTRLNSSHVKISYAVFCLKKKKQRCNRPESHSHEIVHRHEPR